MNKYIACIGLLAVAALYFLRKLTPAQIGLTNSKMNNPFNIRFNPANNWVGQTGSKNGFCTFESPVYGVRAMIKLYNNYLKQGKNNIDSFITKFAPPVENDTVNYIEFVSTKTGLHPSHATLTEKDCFPVLQAMAKMESNFSLNLALFNFAKDVK